MKKFKLLDCTLRDGAYIVNGQFGASAIKGLIKKLQSANIDIIECGWLKDSEYKEGYTFYHTPNDLATFLNDKRSDTLYVVMIDWNRFDVDKLPLYDGNSVDAIRVVFPHGKHNEAIKIGEIISQKGYKVCFQAANTLAYSDSELKDLADAINQTKAISLSVVDTFGAMFEEDIERIVNVLHSTLNNDIDLGLHTHNNQQMAFALSTHFINMFSNVDRNIIVDSSLCGMGRGAGNATTELVANYMNRKCSCNYDMDSIMDAIDVYMDYFKANYQWGYSTPYSIAGMYCCHVNNIAYLINNHRVSAKDMRNIIKSLSPKERLSYDYDLLEEKYIQNQNRKILNSDQFESLSKAFAEKNVLLIAPGESALKDQQKIIKHSVEKKPVVVGINAVIPGYKYDFLFFITPGRYDYALTKYPYIMKTASVIITSNIKDESKLANEFVVPYETVIKRGWVYFDNAFICALRLMNIFKVKSIAIAGFDSFKNKYNESYADRSLPSVIANDKWNELNDEITEMFKDFKQNKSEEITIEFVTDTIFNQ